MGGRIVSRDGATCRHTFALGHWSRVQRGEHLQKKQLRLERFRLSLPQSAWTVGTGPWQHLRHEDPVWIDVTSSWLQVTPFINHGNDCLYDVYGNHQVESLTDSGWQLTGDGIQFDPQPGDCAEGGVRAFCELRKLKILLPGLHLRPIRHE